jgi:hypothetical protein
MMIRRVLVGACAAIVLVLGAQPAHARSSGACQSEINRFCRGQRPVLPCLRANQKDLSPSCTTYVNLFEQMPSCLSDAARLCPTANPSVQTLVGCLRGHKTKVSQECRDEIAKVK